MLVAVTAMTEAVQLRRRSRSSIRLFISVAHSKWLVMASPHVFRYKMGWLGCCLRR
jgi:hypothetical protein